MAADHPITIEAADGTVTVTWRGHMIARSTQALELREAAYPAVYYIPRADAQMQYFNRTDHTSTCPYKGTAHYFSLAGDGATDVNAVWTYETPKPDVAAIAGHLAFYADKVAFGRE